MQLGIVEMPEAEVFNHHKVHLEEEAELHAAAVPQVVLRMQRLVHGAHAQREGGARQRWHLRRAHDALGPRRAAVAVVRTQVPAQKVHLRLGHMQDGKVDAFPVSTCAATI